jgi:ubiquinone/menaquinone biosynthesis C-methylase UbiE
MRITEICIAKDLRSNSLQILEQGPGRDIEYHSAACFSQNSLQGLKHSLQLYLYKLSQRSWRRRAGYSHCKWAQGISFDGKYAAGIINNFIHNSLQNPLKIDVLLPGCNFNSNETRDWLTRRCRSVSLLDIVNWTDSADLIRTKIKNEYNTDISFNIGTLESLPYRDSSFDVIETRAVLEHVGNVRAAAIEMARVLKPSGLCIHAFGPLYFSASGDHCIGAYGLDHVYDHILLDDYVYHQKLSDTSYFQAKGQAVSDSRYWAMKGIFSYLKPREYLDIFELAGFATEVHAIVSNDAVAFRKRCPQDWQKLLNAGLTEEDLLVTGMIVFQRKIGP